MPRSSRGSREIYEAPSEQSSSEEENQQVEVFADDNEDWGAERSAYYDADSVDDASDEELMAQAGDQAQLKAVALTEDRHYFRDVDWSAALTAPEVEAAKESVEFGAVLEQLAKSMRLLTVPNPPTGVGMDFYGAKNALLATYCANLLLFCLLRCQGAETAGHPVLEALVRMRLLLERLPPIEARLSQQRDRLLRAASISEEATGEPLASSKPNVAFLATEVKSDRYVAPKIGATVAPDELKDRRRQRKEDKLAAAGVARRALLDLKNDLADGPEELRDESHDFVAKTTAFEESNFTRIRTKKRNASSDHLSNELLELQRMTDKGHRDKGHRDQEHRKKGGRGNKLYS